ncbi:MAG: hypothetical protein KBD64_02980 [Gammaproteobacteria bacterium]|nr:hypothetical protein [Gammaproteobacteria bacterium]
MSNLIHGVNIIRAYELSWLNLKGKPQLAALEIAQNYQVSVQKPFNTRDLKKFLESLNNQYYEDLDAVKTLIAEYLACDIKIISQAEFSDSKNMIFFEKLHNSCNFGLRFVCDETEQPYLGTLNLILDDKNNKTLLVNLKKELLNLRDLKFSPEDFADKVFSGLMELVQNNIVMSLHLNRRGGISQQFIRSLTDLDFNKFIVRSILE